MFKLNFFGLLAVVGSLNATAEEREMWSAVNPNCTACSGTSGMVYYVRAEGPNDTFHYIWDFSTSPSVFMALTGRGATARFTWNQTHIANITFSQPPYYVYSVIFDQIIEFRGANYTYPNKSIDEPVNKMHTKDFTWRQIQLVNSSIGVSATVEGSSESLEFSGNSTSGGIRITMMAYGTTDHSKLQPHLFHTINATEVRFVLDDLKTSDSTSRFALGLAIVSSDTIYSNVLVNKRTNLDDEHSPGTFQVTEVVTTGSSTGSGGGYLQWRNVAYTSRDPSLNSIATVNVGSLTTVFEPAKELNQTAAFAYYGPALNEHSANYLYVLFGDSVDGFYPSTNFLQWSLLAGYGHPVEETFPLIVIIFGCVALIAVPILLIALFVFISATRRISRARHDLIFSH